ncbi:methyltransferase domain-containing protein [Streptomyces gilvosporeus]|uniref:Methyltransferase type 11 domain-containing protein n=1 Tax=Streptomyces gilvosporeus TaxID=553510 RepID=A0A1V0TZR8_9ACTN|nr:methyltransferase domain-containing protein [Streptomyces gilvosporeus]ARF58436.1 hypothetical protein B1H19_33415 [Streptomyces gilvosporeus]
MVSIGIEGISVAGSDLHAQLDQLRVHSPEMYRRIDQPRLDSWQKEQEADEAVRDDFGSDIAGGRGSSYVRAQQLNVDARAAGIRQLIELMTQRSEGTQAIVDLLGGDGLVRRVCSRIGLSDVEIMTCDASPHMVHTAWATGVPALLQRAERQLFRSGSVDGVLLAYGTHHIPPALRRSVAEESYRVLRPGGAFLLHDFLSGSPMDTWFSKVVDRYSHTGHQYAHFSEDEIGQYLAEVGFDFKIMEIDDSYTATGVTADEAEQNLGEYLVDMYGLRKVVESLGPQQAHRWAIEEAKSIFRYPEQPGMRSSSTVQRIDDTGLWRCTVPRRAVIGLGWKP